VTLQNQRYSPENTVTKSQFFYQNCFKLKQIRDTDSLIYSFYPNGKTKSFHYYRFGILNIVREFNEYGQEKLFRNNQFKTHEVKKYNNNRITNSFSYSGTIDYSYLKFDKENNWTFRSITHLKNGEVYKIYEHRKIEYY